MLLFGLFGGKHLLLFLFGQVLVLHDIKLSLRALLITRCVGALFSFTRFLASLLLNVFQEAVVSVSDQVQTAWFAVLLKFSTHELQSLVLIHSLFRVIKSHAVFLANKFAKEVVNVAFRFKILVKLTVDTETACQIGFSLVCTISGLVWKILHLLFQEFVVGFKNDGILGKNLVTDGEAWECISISLLWVTFHLFSTLFRSLIALDRVKEDSFCVVDVTRISIKYETLVHASWSSNMSLD